MTVVRVCGTQMRPRTVRHASVPPLRLPTTHQVSNPQPRMRLPIKKMIKIMGVFVIIMKLLLFFFKSIYKN